MRINNARLNIQAMKTTHKLTRLSGLFLCLLCFSAGAQTEANADSPLVGSWGGALVIGEDDLGLIFNFTESEGEFSATMISDGLGIYGMPADRVRVNGISLTINIRRLDVEFTGTLRFDDAGEELLRIDASWFQGSEMVPVVLRPVD